MSTLFDVDEAFGPSAPGPKRPSRAPVPPRRPAGRTQAALAPELEKPTVAPGDESTTQRRVIEALGRLDSFDHDSAALLAAWQQMATAPAMWPQFADPAPALAELDGPGAFGEAWDLVAQVWPHLADHATTAVRMVERTEADDWKRAVAILAPEVVAAGGFDLGGEVRQQMRAQSTIKRLSAYYTPETLCRLMADLAASGLDGDGSVRRKWGRAEWQGKTVLDLCAGTCRLLLPVVARAAAAGADPWSTAWCGIDLDGEALAIGALNLVRAGAGPHVWLHRGDGLGTRFVYPDGTLVGFYLVIGNPPYGGRAKLKDTFET